MRIEDLNKMIGEWTGIGTMDITGIPQGQVIETLKIEATDFPESISYIRKSRIRFPGQPDQTHNEFGYIRTDKSTVILSGGTVVHLPWNADQGKYIQDFATPDTENMIRSVQGLTNTNMFWHNIMDVITESGRSTHEIQTDFTSITKV